MKKSHLLLVLLITFFSMTNYAQSNKYGIRLGVGLPNLQSLDNNIYSKDYESVAGFDGALFADFGITERFSIKAELGFARKGGERNGIQPVPSTTLNSTPEGQALSDYLALIGVETIYADFESKAVFTYIEIPVLAKYEWSLGETWGVYVNGGPYVSFIINPKQITNSDGQIAIYIDEGQTALEVPYPPDFQTLGPAFGDFTATTDIDKDLATMDFGAMLGVGATANITENSELLFEVRGSYGFIPLQNDIDLYGSVHMGSVTFSLGYAYTFPKKAKSATQD